MLWIHKGYFVVKKLVWNVFLKLSGIQRKLIYLFVYNICNLNRWYRTTLVSNSGNKQNPKSLNRSFGFNISSFFVNCQNSIFLNCNYIVMSRHINRNLIFLSILIDFSLNYKSQNSTCTAMKPFFLFFPHLGKKDENKREKTVQNVTVCDSQL